MEFQAVVLAGGRGDQMLDLTSSVPKPLLPVGNYPLIWYTLNTLCRAGFRDVIVITLNSAVNQVKQISSLFNLNCDIIGISEDSDCGTIGSLKLIRDKVRTDLILLSCDLLHDYELHKLADAHRIHNPSITMLLASVRSEYENVPGLKQKRRRKKTKEVFGLGKCDKIAGRVVFVKNEADLEDGHLPVQLPLMMHQSRICVRSDLTDVHTYIIKKWLFDLISSESEESRSSFREDVLPHLVRKQWKHPKAALGGDLDSVNVTSLSQQNSDVETKNAFALLRQQSSNKKIMDLSLKTAASFGNATKERTPLSVYACVYEKGLCLRVNTLSSFVDANRMIIKSQSSIAPQLANVPLVHSSVKVEEKTQIGSDSIIAEDTCIGIKGSIKRTTIGKSCTIGSHVKLVNCTILDNVAIKDWCMIQNSVVCNGVEIGEKCSVKDCLIGFNYILQPGTILSSESLVESAAMMDLE